MQTSIQIIGIIKHSLMITSFVLMMMLIIEYINVQTKGKWQEKLKHNRFWQYVLVSFLGVTPGCLGAFTVVSLYSHKIVSFGALVAVMIATSGDEAFVMFSMFPKDAFLINIILFVLAIFVGIIVDFLIKDKQLIKFDHEFEVHKKKECICFSKDAVIKQLKNMIFPRALLLTLFGLFILSLSVGALGGNVWNWKKIIFVVGSLISLFIIATVPNHFLKEHIYKHIIKKHLLRVFLWTFGALFVVHFIENYLDITSWMKDNMVWVLSLATAIGIIPESGPHMVFVTMYAKELIPFAVLLASSISQDGHGTLPLLAVSRRIFVYVKLINIFIAFTVGLLFLTFLN